MTGAATDLSPALLELTEAFLDQAAAARTVSHLAWIDAVLSGVVGALRSVCLIRSGTSMGGKAPLARREPCDVDMESTTKYNPNMSDVLAQAPCIRKYRPDDATCLHRIDQICFAADIAFTRGELLFYLGHPESITLVAEGNHKIIGFALGRVLQNSLAHVLTLDVVPEARRQRIGTLLMRTLHDEFKSRTVSHVMLEVSTRNPAALRLYEALQYRVVEILQGYYKGREDAYRMMLSL